MNWVLLVVLIILLGYGVKGYKKGLIRTIFSTFAFLIAAALTLTLSPMISDALHKNEKVMNYVETKVSSLVTKEADTNKVTQQVEVIDKLPLPKVIRDSLAENNNTEVYQNMATTSFEQYLTKYLSGLVINCASYIILFLIVYILLWVIARALDLVSKLPILHGANKTAGLLVGLVQGFITVWVLCIVLTIFSGSDIAQKVFVQINESQILTAIYDNNLLVHYITKFAISIF